MVYDFLDDSSQNEDSSSYSSRNRRETSSRTGFIAPSFYKEYKEDKSKKKQDKTTQNLHSAIKELTNTLEKERRERMKYGKTAAIAGASVIGIGAAGKIAKTRVGASSQEKKLAKEFNDSMETLERTTKRVEEASRRMAEVSEASSKSVMTSISKLDSVIHAFQDTAHQSIKMMAAAPMFAAKQVGRGIKSGARAGAQMLTESEQAQMFEESLQETKKAMKHQALNLLFGMNPVLAMLGSGIASKGLQLGGRGLEALKDKLDDWRDRRREKKYNDDDFSFLVGKKHRGGVVVAHTGMVLENQRGQRRPLQKDEQVTVLKEGETVLPTHESSFLEKFANTIATSISRAEQINIKTAQAKLSSSGEKQKKPVLYLAQKDFFEDMEQSLRTVQLESEEGLYGKKGDKSSVRTVFTHVVPVFGSQFKSELPKVQKIGIMAALYKLAALQYVHSRFASKEQNELLIQQSKIQMTGLGVGGTIKSPRARSFSQAIAGGIKKMTGLGGERDSFTAKGRGLQTGITTSTGEVYPSIESFLERGWGQFYGGGLLRMRKPKGSPHDKYLYETIKKAINDSDGVGRRGERIIISGGGDPRRKSRRRMGGIIGAIRNFLEKRRQQKRDNFLFDKESPPSEKSLLWNILKKGASDVWQDNEGALSRTKKILGLGKDLGLTHLFGDNSGVGYKILTGLRDDIRKATQIGKDKLLAAIVREKDRRFLRKAEKRVLSGFSMPEPRYRNPENRVTSDQLADWMSGEDVGGTFAGAILGGASYTPEYTAAKRFMKRKNKFEQRIKKIEEFDKQARIAKGLTTNTRSVRSVRPLKKETDSRLVFIKNIQRNLDRAATKQARALKKGELASFRDSNTEESLFRSVNTMVAQGLITQQDSDMLRKSYDSLFDAKLIGVNSEQNIIQEYRKSGQEMGRRIAGLPSSDRLESGAFFYRVYDYLTRTGRREEASAFNKGFGEGFDKVVSRTKTSLPFQYTRNVFRQEEENRSMAILQRAMGLQVSLPPINEERMFVRSSQPQMGSFKGLSELFKRSDERKKALEPKKEDVQPSEEADKNKEKKRKGNATEEAISAKLGTLITLQSKSTAGVSAMADDSQYQRKVKVKEEKESLWDRIKKGKKGDKKDIGEIIGKYSFSALAGLILPMLTTAIFGGKGGALKAGKGSVIGAIAGALLGIPAGIPGMLLGTAAGSMIGGMMSGFAPEKFDSIMKFYKANSKGAMYGGIIGGALGLMFGPMGFAAGATIGSFLGGKAQELYKGMDDGKREKVDPYLKEMSPSALLANKRETAMGAGIGSILGLLLMGPTGAIFGATAGAFLSGAIRRIKTGDDEFAKKMKEIYGKYVGGKSSEWMIGGGIGTTLGLVFSGGNIPLAVGIGALGGLIGSKLGDITSRKDESGVTKTFADSMLDYKGDALVGAGIGAVSGLLLGGFNLPLAASMAASGAILFPELRVRSGFSIEEQVKNILKIGIKYPERLVGGAVAGGILGAFLGLPIGFPALIPMAAGAGAYLAGTFQEKSVGGSGFGILGKLATGAGKAAIKHPFITGKWAAGGAVLGGVLGATYGGVLGIKPGITGGAIVGGLVGTAASKLEDLLPGSDLITGATALVGGITGGVLAATATKAVPGGGKAKVMSVSAGVALGTMAGTAIGATGSLIGKGISYLLKKIGVGNEIANKFGAMSGGAISGAITGAILGSIVPGFGTALGAAVGSVVGATIGHIGTKQWNWTDYFPVVATTASGVAGAIVGGILAAPGGVTIPVGVGIGAALGTVLGEIAGAVGSTAGWLAKQIGIPEPLADLIGAGGTGAIVGAVLGGLLAAPATVGIGIPVGIGVGAAVGGIIGTGIKAFQESELFDNNLGLGITGAMGVTGAIIGGMLGTVAGVGVGMVPGIGIGAFIGTALGSVTIWTMDKILDLFGGSDGKQFISDLGGLKSAGASASAIGVGTIIGTIMGFMLGGVAGAGIGASVGAVAGPMILVALEARRAAMDVEEARRKEEQTRKMTDVVNAGRSPTAGVNATILSEKNQDALNNILSDEAEEQRRKFAEGAVIEEIKVQQQAIKEASLFTGRKIKKTERARLAQMQTKEWQEQRVRELTAKYRDRAITDALGPQDSIYLQQMDEKSKRELLVKNLEAAEATKDKAQIQFWEERLKRHDDTVKLNKERELLVKNTVNESVPTDPSKATAKTVEAKAKGGITQADLTLVGEEGPELVALPKGSRVMSNKDMKEAIGGGDAVPEASAETKVPGSTVNESVPTDPSKATESDKESIFSNDAFLKHQTNEFKNKKNRPWEKKKKSKAAAKTDVEQNYLSAPPSSESPKKKGFLYDIIKGSLRSMWQGMSLLFGVSSPEIDAMFEDESASNWDIARSVGSTAWSGLSDWGSSAIDTAKDVISYGGQIIPNTITGITEYVESRMNPGLISQDNNNAKAYGIVQYNEKGLLPDFIEWSPYKNEFSGLKPGTPEFDQKWVEIAQREPEKFADIQRKGIIELAYKRYASGVLQRTGIDVTQLPTGIQGMLVSTATQFSPKFWPKLDEIIKKKDSISPVEMIREIVKRKTEGFPGTANRYKIEEKIALIQLAGQNVIGKAKGIATSAYNFVGSIPAEVSSAVGKIKNLLYYPPVPGTITSGYGTRKDPITGEDRMHYGIDYGIPSGTEVKSVAPGFASFGFDPNGYGWYVSVDHPGNVSSVYGHLSKNMLPSGGKEVKAGEVIGLSGGEKGHPGAGKSTGPHLHFGTRLGHQGKNWFNPMMVFSHKSGETATQEEGGMTGGGGGFIPGETSKIKEGYSAPITKENLISTLVEKTISKGKTTASNTSRFFQELGEKFQETGESLGNLFTNATNIVVANMNHNTQQTTSALTSQQQSNPIGDDLAELTQLLLKGYSVDSFS